MLLLSDLDTFELDKVGKSHFLVFEVKATPDAMEHFPLIGDKLKALLSVRLRDEIPYDNGGFHGFELRAGFDQREIYYGLFVGNSSLLQHPPSRYASLLQSWFYWAFVCECLDFSINFQDYLEQGPADTPLLTTKSLERDVTLWAKRLEAAELEVAAAQIDNARNVLEKVEFCLKRLSDRIQEAGTSLHDGESQYWLANGREILPHDLEVSICALGFSLDHAVKAVSSVLGLDSALNGTPNLARWYTPPFFLSLSESLGFCKTDAQHFKDGFGFVTVCMAVSLPGLSMPGAHLKCSEDHCEADNIKSDEYKQIHIQDGCGCSELKPLKTFHDALKIIDEGAIPTVRLKPRTSAFCGDIDFEVIKAIPGTRYLAYSHLWADGRGNISENGLFECQWRWLQEGAQLYKNGDPHIASASLESLFPFWIDTFCVPRGSDDRLWDLRTKAILSMSDVYRNAEVVVVLDSMLERSIGDAVSALEFAMRVKFCGWNRRVWTLHEGAVAQKLLVRLNTKFVDLWEVKFELMETTRTPVRNEYGWHIFASFENEYRISALVQSFSLLLSKITHSEREIFYFAWMEVPQRATTFINDQYLVMAIIMRAGKEILLALQRSKSENDDLEASQREKLKLILVSAPAVSQRVIFTFCKRFPEFGMQWAPSKLGGELPRAQIDGSDDLLKRIPNKGAIVRFKGWRLTGSLPNPVDPIILVKIDQQQESEGGYLISLTDSDRKDFGIRFPPADPCLKLAIILSPDPLRAEMLNGFKAAVLARELGVLEKRFFAATEGSCVLHVEYLVSIRVHALREGRTPSQHIEAEWVNNGEDQLWCVG